MFDIFTQFKLVHFMTHEEWTEKCDDFVGRLSLLIDNGAVANVISRAAR